MKTYGVFGIVLLLLHDLTIMAQTDFKWAWSKSDKKWERGSATLDPINDVVYWATRSDSRWQLIIMNKLKIIQTVVLGYQPVESQVQLLYDSNMSRLLLFSLNTTHFTVATVHINGSVTVLNQMKNQEFFFEFSPAILGPNSTFLLKLARSSGALYMYFNLEGKVIWNRTTKSSAQSIYDIQNEILYISEYYLVYKLDIASGRVNEVKSRMIFNEEMCTINDMQIQKNDQSSKLLLLWADDSNFLPRKTFYLQIVDSMGNTSSPIYLDKVGTMRMHAVTQNNVYFEKMLPVSLSWKIERVTLANDSVTASSTTLWDGLSWAPETETWVLFGSDFVWLNFLLKEKTDIQGWTYPPGRTIVGLRRGGPSGNTPTPIHTASPTPKVIDSSPLPKSNILLLILLPAITLLLMIVTMLTIIYRMKKMKRSEKEVSMEKLSQKSFDASTNMPMEQLSRINYTTFTEMTYYSQAESRQCLSIPGFLQISLKKNVRFGKRIAHQAHSDVFIVELLDENLIQKAKSRKAVAKVSLIRYNDKKATRQFHQELSLCCFLSQKYPFYFAKLYAYDDILKTQIIKYYNEGSLEKWISVKRNKLEIVSILLDVARGVAAMHLEDIVHCDLKPENILIDYKSKESKYVGVIADFGIAKILKKHELNVKEFKPIDIRGLSVKYAAPESFLYLRDRTVRIPDGETLKASDVYSYSCILYRCVCSTIPWANNSCLDNVVANQHSSDIPMFKFIH